MNGSREKLVIHERGSRYNNACLCVIGAPGTGKTTALKILAGCRFKQRAKSILGLPNDFKMTVIPKVTNRPGRPGEANSLSPLDGVNKIALTAQNFASRCEKSLIDGLYSPDLTLERVNTYGYPADMLVGARGLNVAEPSIFQIRAIEDLMSCQIRYIFLIASRSYRHELLAKRGVVEPQRRIRLDYGDAYTFLLLLVAGFKPESNLKIFRHYLGYSSLNLICDYYELLKSCNHVLSGFGARLEKLTREVRKISGGMILNYLRDEIVRPGLFLPELEQAKLMWLEVGDFAKPGQSPTEQGAFFEKIINEGIEFVRSNLLT